MKITLKRDYQDATGTHGYLKKDGEILCYTLERPWADNKPNESCIPKGVYECAPHSGKRFKDVWEVLDVPERKAILFHAGNTVEDTHGCILVGQVRTPFGVGNSKVALKYLRDILPGHFTLEII